MEEKMEEIKHRFWKHENRFWLDVNFNEKEELPTPIGVTARIYFIEKKDSVCTHLNCDCLGTPAIVNKIILELDEDGVAKIIENNMTIIHHIGLNTGVAMTKKPSK